MRSDLLCYELRSTSTYPNANVLHSASPRQMLRHLSSTFVSVRLKVLSNGSIAPKAIRSKQSEKSKAKKSQPRCRIAQQRNRDYVTRNQLFGVNSSKNIYDSQTKQRTCVVRFSAGFFFLNVRRPGLRCSPQIPVRTGFGTGLGTQHQHQSKILIYYLIHIKWLRLLLE